MRRDSGARARFSRWCRRADDHDLRPSSEVKIFSASYTATEPTDTLRGWDAGFGADVLGTLKAFLKGFVQPAAGVPCCSAMVVGFFQLPEDFCFAQHHRIEAAATFEKMFEAVGSLSRIEFHPSADPGNHVFDEEIAEGRETLRAVPGA